MQRLPIAAAPRLTEGQESDGIAVIGEGAVVGGCTAASRSVLEGDAHSRAVMHQTHKPDSFVTTTGQKEQSQD